MPFYRLHPMSASVQVEDVPLHYAPPRGPAVELHLRYKQRVYGLGRTPVFGHAGRGWQHDWHAYVTDNNTTAIAPYTKTIVTLRGEGVEEYNPYTGDTLEEPGAVRANRTRCAALRTALWDGTVEVYAFPDRAASLPNRNVFLTELIDPQGQTLTFTYDASIRLVAVTDALGQVTTLDYQDAGDPLRVTKVTDPFGRIAMLSYNSAGQLVAVTDAIGMTSRFAYDATDFLLAMTTPYGTTTFRNKDAAGMDCDQEHHFCALRALQALLELLTYSSESMKFRS
jgi:YD repeat-containing protein